MANHKILHPADDINRLFVSRKDREGPANFEDDVNALIRTREDSIKKNK